MPQLPPDIAPEIVRGDLTDRQLEVYMASDMVAVDTETMGLNPLRDRLCLVQLCDRSGHATLVQIPAETLSAAGPRAPRLRRLLEGPRVLKVFHFARFDVATLLHHLQIRVDPIYCTRTASKLARTYTDRHGLRDVVLELLDVELDKAACHTDWSRPALDPTQVRYAVSDVSLLLPLMDRLEAMLESEGRRALARAAFSAIPVLAQLDLLGFVDLFSH